MKDVDKNLEILTLRHRLAIPQRQIDRHRPPPDRAVRRISQTVDGGGLDAEATSSPWIRR
jgi:hypothetical protein